jgi:hypothetical protein
MPGLSYRSALSLHCGCRTSRGLVRAWLAFQPLVARFPIQAALDPHRCSPGGPSGFEVTAPRRTRPAPLPRRRPLATVSAAGVASWSADADADGRAGAPCRSTVRSSGRKCPAGRRGDRRPSRPALTPGHPRARPDGSGGRRKGRCPRVPYGPPTDREGPVSAGTWVSTGPRASRPVGRQEASTRSTTRSRCASRTALAASPNVPQHGVWCAPLPGPGHVNA